jgi:hypothetical protein
MALYLDQYGIFGDPEVLPLKVFWDYTYYWGVLARLYYKDGLTDLRVLQILRDELGPMQQLNVAMQDFVREMCRHSRKRNQRVMLDQASLPWFHELNRALADRFSTEEFRQVMRAANRRLRQLATDILDRSCADHPALDGTALLLAIERAGGAVRGEPSLLFPALKDEPEAALSA